MQPLFPRDPSAPAFVGGFDDEPIAYVTLGDGPPVLMIHGLMTDAARNWIDPGVAQALVEAGYQVILPDLRGHGASGAPKSISDYPPDALAMDIEALIDALGLTGFDLVGYSLGGRVAVRLLVRGVRPRRCVIAGMGDGVFVGDGPRRKLFEAAIKGPGGSAMTARMHAFFKQSGMSAEAVLGVLATQVDTDPAALAAIETPVLCLSGEDDNDNGSAEALAAAFSNGSVQRKLGNHLSAPGEPAFAEALIKFLIAP